MLRQETGNFSLIVQKSKSFGFWSKFFPEVLSSAVYVESLPGFLLKFLRMQKLRTWRRWRVHVPRIGKFSLKVRKMIKIEFFSEKKFNLSKICSGHMECSFGNSADFVLPETQKILAQCPKVRKVLFLPDSRPLDCSTGPVECLTDEPWVFLQIRFSSEKPSKDVKLYLPPKKVLPKSSSGHVEFVLDTLVENFCRKPGTSSLKIRKVS